MISSTILLLPQDLKEKAKIERSRQNEEERKKRIFNTKIRMIGVDSRELQRQIEEKHVMKELKEIEEYKHYKNQMYTLQVANKLETDMLEEKRRLNGELDLFRKICQRKENQRDFDLSNPLLKCTERDSHPGVSSGQVFEGEDSNAKTRKSIQIEQQKTWLLQQMAEKKQKKNAEELSGKMYKESLKARENTALSLENLERECRRQKQLANEAYNKALAKEQVFKAKVTKERDMLDKQIEIMNTTNSDLLTENSKVAQSNLGPHKVIQYHYKGMSESEKQEIRKKQMEQIIEHKELLEAEHSFNMKWARFNAHVNNFHSEKEQYQINQEREKLKTIIEENKILSSKQKRSNLSELKMAQSKYTTTEFMKQFNKSSR